MNDYDQMLERLWAYRKALGLGQEELCTVLGISQEQYSYLENGYVKLTDDNLKAFYGIGLNIDQLLIGKKYDFAADDLDSALNSLNDTDKDFAMKMAAEIVLEKWSRKGSDAADGDEAKTARMLKAALRAWEDFSMVGFIREDQEYSQLEMAQLLGIGIRKYRALERENIYPDADLLLSLYRISGYPPSLFMNIYDRRLAAVSTIWRTLSSHEKEDIVRFITQLDALI